MMEAHKNEQNIWQYRFTINVKGLIIAAYAINGISNDNTLK